MTLSISRPMAMTEMWCGDEKNAQEAEYLKILQKANSFKMDHGNLILYCGQKTITLKRTPP